MNIKLCPKCQWPMKTMRRATPQGPRFLLVCPVCGHEDPLPVDQEIKRAKAHRLL